MKALSTTYEFMRYEFMRACYFKEAYKMFILFAMKSKPLTIDIRDKMGFKYLRIFHCNIHVRCYFLCIATTFYIIAFLS